MTGPPGSPADWPQREPYRRLFAQHCLVRGAVDSMASADLPALIADCSRLHCQTASVLGAQDRWIPVRSLRPVIQRHLPQADVQAWAGGHLVHEEQPLRAAARVLALLDAAQ